MTRNVPKTGLLLMITTDYGVIGFIGLSIIQHAMII
jgi:hypothetical protein